MKLFIQEETLNEIGNAIREKTETGDLIAPGDMPGMIRGIVSGADPVIQELEISSNGTYNTYEGVDGFAPIRVNVPQDGAPTAAELNFTGSGSYRFAHGAWDWFIKKYGNQITINVDDADHMFYQSKYVGELPFEINLTPGYVGHNMQTMFQFAGADFNVLPKINGAKPSYLNDFIGYSYIHRVPDDYFDNFDWSLIENETSSYSNRIGSMTQSAYKLRSFPWKIYKHENKNVASSYVYFSAFNYMEELDEAVDLPIPFTQAFTSNVFGYSGLHHCYRIKDFTFELDENGQPLVKEWKSQNMDMSNKWGWGEVYTGYSTITEDKQVTDDASYQALKDDPDWYSLKVEYSRYNHDSAVRTIQSLPDTSAYLATAGGTNTIKFTGEAGSKTDGGAIATLTDAEIAVAAAKGWTVSLI